MSYYVSYQTIPIHEMQTFNKIKRTLSYYIVRDLKIYLLCSYDFVENIVNITGQEYA